MKRSHTYKYKIASNDFTIYNTILIVHTNKLSHRKKWSENKLNENCGVLSSAGSSIIDSTSTQRHGVKEKRKSNFYWAGNKRQHQHYQHKKRVQHRLHDSATIIHWNHHFRRLSVWITFFFRCAFPFTFFLPSSPPPESIHQATTNIFTSIRQFIFSFVFIACVSFGWFLTISWRLKLFPLAFF